MAEMLSQLVKDVGGGGGGGGARGVRDAAVSFWRREDKVWAIPVGSFHLARFWSGLGLLGSCLYPVFHC